MSSRTLNDLEQRLHQAALADAKKTLTQKEIEVLVSDQTARTDAINFLLGTGLFRLLKDAKGNISFRAVAKKELDIKKDLAGEESMVLSHIQAAGNEGMWTKHLKAKTELHQTVIDRCLKSLGQKQLVKSVKSVKHPTRKIYMLYHLTPSVDVTGGPWYTDNELDTEFIKLLSSACLRFIRDKTLPKIKSDSHPIYAISSSPSYPSAQYIQAFLSKSKITETQLSVEHIEMLLNVLVMDGEIEKIPAFGTALWETKSNESDDSVDKKSRKRKSQDRDGRKSRNRSGMKEDEDSDEDADDAQTSKKSKGPKTRKRKVKVKEEKTSDSDSAEDMRPKRRRKEVVGDTENEDSGSNDERTKSRAGRKRNHISSNSSSSDSELETGRHRHRKKKKISGETSLPAPEAMSHTYEDYGGAFVYRAIRQERLAFSLSQAPCGRCPQFDFCKDRGPVNPRECEYYGRWLEGMVLKVEQ